MNESHQHNYQLPHKPQKSLTTVPELSDISFDSLIMCVQCTYAIAHSMSLGWLQDIRNRLAMTTTTLATCLRGHKPARLSSRRIHQVTPMGSSCVILTVWDVLLSEWDFEHWTVSFGLFVGRSICLCRTICMCHLRCWWRQITNCLVCYLYTVVRTVSVRTHGSGRWWTDPTKLPLH